MPVAVHPFEPIHLSPIRKAAVACPLPYGLTWEDLQPFLPGFHKQRIIKPQAYSSYEKQGLHGGANSCILTVRYPTAKNGFRSTTFFVKSTTDPEKREAQKYQFLAAHGVPTPRPLGSVHKNGNEIIFLEFLPIIGIDFRSAREVDNLLCLAAHLNSIQDRPRLLEQPPRNPSSDAVFDETVYDALLEISRDQKLSVKIDVQRWFDAYKITQKSSRAMPRAINHNEFYFQQVGWAERNHEEQRQLVLFDLETMSLSPRFTDIAGILHPLGIYTGRDQVELFKVYLDRFRCFHPLDLDIDEALQELRVLRFTTSCYSLPWLAGWARHSDAPYDQLRMNLSCMWDDLRALQLL